MGEVERASGEHLASIHLASIHARYIMYDILNCSNNDGFQGRALAT